MLRAILVLCLVIFPFVSSDFITFQIGTYSMILGAIALSTMMLAGYGGMVSLSQITVAGIAGYMVAIFGTNTSDVMGFGLSPLLVVFIALFVGALSGALIGAISVRTEGIYTIMITLAIAVCVSYFARQNYELLNGFTGFTGLDTPHLGPLDLGGSKAFYFLSLALAIGAYLAVNYGAKSAFGLSLQATRDNARRMRALGYDVTQIRILAHLFAGLIAAGAGVMLVWFNARISPATIGVDVAIDILIIAVIGGLRHPIGPFLGALVFILLETFAIDLVNPERFNTLIGIIFLAIVMMSNDGLWGLITRLYAKADPKWKNHVKQQEERT